MRCLLLIVIFNFTTFAVKSQSAEHLISELKSINKAILLKPCSKGNSPVISNRAMNIFLANKTGYLSESIDLSLYTNYVTLNTTDGKFSVNHNFQKVTGIDEPIKKFFSAGLYANIANNSAAPFLDKKMENDFGVTFSYKWLSKVKTQLINCSQEPNKGNQKQVMDAFRSLLLHSLEIEIKQKETAFKTAINAIDTTDVLHQHIDSTKAILQHNFYESLGEEYREKFARLQAETLAKTNNFRLITTGWTSLTANFPLVFPKYFIATSLTTTFQEKHPYPLDILLNHTRLWESSKTGRLFLTIGGRLLLNNSKLSYDLDKTSYSEYKNQGGTDTLHLATLKNEKTYIGYHETFITPSIKGRVVYFPPSSHIGFSFLIEQNFGSYNLLNGRLGIPVVLINKKKLPAANFEFYVLFFDMNGKIAPARKPGNKTFVGLGIGIPFSRLMY